MVAPNISPQCTVSQAKKIDFSDLDEEYLGLDADAGYIYSLNATGFHIWERIAEPITVAALCAELGAAFNIAPAACEPDVIELLTALQTAELITVQDGAVG